MEEIGIKLQKAVLIMMSIVWMLGMSSCEDRLDTPRPFTGGGKTVEVSLCVGIADEVDAGSLEAGPATTKVIGSGGKAGFRGAGHDCHRFRYRGHNRQCLRNG